MECKLPCCENEEHASGLCMKHRDRYARWGNYCISKRIYSKLSPKTKCSVDSCNSYSKAFGFCSKHYNRFRKHGDPNITLREQHRMNHTSEYSTWISMLDRCRNINNSSYHRYGGRGICVCDRWSHSFTEFLKDMGLKPFKGAQIDRIDNDGNYEPCNCRWVDAKTNIRNSSATIITIEVANKIRELYETGMYKITDLEDKFPIKKSQIGNIIRGESWV